MATDSNKMGDAVDVEINPGDEGERGKSDKPTTIQVDTDGKLRRVTDETPLPIGDKPTSDKKSDWVNYCVKLGADRHYLTHDTEHGMDGTDDVEVHPALTLKELQQLAYDLGG